VEKALKFGEAVFDRLAHPELLVITEQATQGSRVLLDGLKGVGNLDLLHLQWKSQIVNNLVDEDLVLSPFRPSQSPGQCRLHL